MSPEVFLSEREKPQAAAVALDKQKSGGQWVLKLCPLFAAAARLVLSAYLPQLFPFFFSFFCSFIVLCNHRERERDSLMCKLNGSFGFLVLFAQKHWRFALVLLGGHHRLPSRGSQVCSECSVCNRSQKRYFKVHQELIILMITQWTDWLSWVEL